jgi:NAD(P)H-hydrate epimerase
MSALAVEASGADLVFVCVPARHEEVAKHVSVNVQVHPFAGDALSLKDVPAILALLAQSDCAVIGPGLDHNAGTWRAIAHLIKNAPCPLVLDASALQADTLKAAKGARCVLTPHAGELDRLGIPPAKLGKYAKTYGLTIHLKGAIDRIAFPDGTETTVKGGNPGLTVGGTGDALAGLTAGLIAQHLAVREACPLAARVIKRVGDELFKTHGFAYRTRDVIRHIPALLRKLSAPKITR